MTVKSVMPVLLVSVLTGACAAAAAMAISGLTSATLSPLGGGLLGLAFGITAGNITGRRPAGAGRLASALLRGTVAGLTAALVIVLIARTVSEAPGAAGRRVESA